MLFMTGCSFRPQDRDVVLDRFKNTGGLPGPGAKMLGRWHGLGGHRGFLLAESSDGVANRQVDAGVD